MLNKEELIKLGISEDKAENLESVLLEKKNNFIADR